MSVKHAGGAGTQAGVYPITPDGRSKSAKRAVGLPKVYAAVLNGKTKTRPALWNVKGPSGTKNAVRSY